MNFGPIDWVVTVVYLAVSVAFGIKARRYVEDLAGYIVAGRKVGVSLGVATFVATEIGTVTYVYFGELGYVAGFSAFFIGILTMVAYIIVGRTGFIVEGLRRHRVMTIPEFYELKYSRGIFEVLQRFDARDIVKEPPAACEHEHRVSLHFEQIITRA